MIYTKKEQEQFKLTKARFAKLFTGLLETMLATYERKGQKRDVGSPIHHRQSPSTMLAIAQAKTRRIESILSQPAWEREKSMREAVIEECVDAANYMLYIGALCLLLEEG